MLAVHEFGDMLRCEQSCKQCNSNLVYTSKGCSLIVYTRLELYCLHDCSHRNMSPNCPDCAICDALPYAMDRLRSCSTICDGSASILCQTGYYHTYSQIGEAVCQACPAGNLCPDGSGVCYFHTHSARQKCPNSDSDLVGDWIPDRIARFWTLLSCPLGYFAINISRDTSGCAMCEANTYSLDSISGCQGGVCAVRECSPCPEGASCQKGSLPLHISLALNGQW